MVTALMLKLSLIFSVRLPAAAQPDSEPAPIISAIDVHLLDVPPELNQTLWLHAARSLIPIEPEAEFSEVHLKAVLDALKTSNLFESIHLESETSGDRIRLMFALSPFRRVRDIRIKGQFPLFKTDILRVMTIHPGSVFSSKQDPLRQQQRIAALYQREGFESAKVSIRTEENPENLTVIVHVRIDKGPFFRLKELHIEGNRAAGDSGIKRRMSIWRRSLLLSGAGRFKEQDLKHDVEQLTEWYRRKGYADATVEHRVEKNPAAGEVAVWLTIEEGPYYEITFTGNRHFGSRTLRKDLILFKDGNLHDFGLKRSAQNIIARYRSSGFPRAQVIIDEAPAGAGNDRKRRINFSIAEGSRQTVAAVRITGNRSIANKDILEQLLTRPKELFHDGALNPDVLEADLYAVKALYLKHGFMAAEIRQTTTMSGEENVVVDIVINEGRQAKIVATGIVGSHAITEAEVMDAVQMKPGQPFREYMLQSDKNALSAFISEKGHPHVTIEPRVSFNEDRSQAKIVYHVEDGPEVRVGNIYFLGNFRTVEARLQRELMLQSGQRFSLQRMLQGQRNLNNMNIFNRVNVRAIGLREKFETVDLFVEVEEKKPLYVEASVGYDTERGFYTQGRGGDRNFLGRNKDVWLSGEYSQIGYKAEVGIAEPKLWGWPVSAGGSLFAEETQEFNQEFGTRVIGASAGLKRKWSLKWTTGIGVRFEDRQQFVDNGKQSVYPDELESRSVFVVTPSVRYDSRDSFVRPKRGIITGLDIDVSSGLNNALDDLVKYRFDFRYFTTPFEPLTLAWIGRAGHINALSANGAVYEDQLFFLGGTGDVRGYEENLLRFDAAGKPVGGKTAISTSMEARLDVGRNFEITAFFDTGRVTRVLKNEGSDDFQSSVGLGIRYHTPIGPIGLLYGHKLDPRVGESSGRWHFAIGYTF